jgi:hypothetical protein
MSILSDYFKAKENYKREQAERRQVDAVVSPLIIAFVQGAKWWEWHKENATMWQGDQRLAEEEALKREKNGTLGKLPDFIKEG